MRLTYEQRNTLKAAIAFHSRKSLRSGWEAPCAFVNNRIGRGLRRDMRPGALALSFWP